MFRPQKTAASARFLDSKFLITGVTKPCAEEFLLNPSKKKDAEKGLFDLLRLTY
jgi:hypothetical protein